MKQKDVLYIVVAVAILGVAGYLGLNALKPSATAAKTATVEVVTPMSSEFNSDALKTLSDRSKSVDYYVRPDLTTGLNNPSPFGQ